MSNRYGILTHVYGDTRYTTVNMPIDQRLQLIVLTNRSPEDVYWRGTETTEDDRRRMKAFTERFTVIHLTQEWKPQDELIE